MNSQAERIVVMRAKVIDALEALKSASIEEIDLLYSDLYESTQGDDRIVARSMVDTARCFAESEGRRRR
jgi:hypothetical protein